MKTKTQARTAPAVALRRVAAIAAVLLTLCLVFMMPVGAAEEDNVPIPPKASIVILTEDEAAGHTLAVQYIPLLDVWSPDAQLEYYSGWNFDIVLTLNKEFSLLSNAGDDGNYISIMIGDNEWNSKLISQTFPANERISVMDLLFQEDTKPTCIAIADGLRYGIHLDESSIDTEPVGFEGCIELIITNPSNIEEKITISNFDFTDDMLKLLTESELPTATITEMDVDDLTFALKFAADPVTDVLLNTYGSWNADFVLTVNKDITVKANGDADGYLAGQYDSFGDFWLNVPPGEGVLLKANTPFLIMKYAREDMKYNQFDIKYNDIVSFVGVFNCGLFLSPAYIENNEDLLVTLELCLISPDESVRKSIAKFDFKTSPDLTFYDDGEVIGGPITVEYGSETTEITIPTVTKTGYTFKEWTSSEEGISITNNVLNKIPVRDVDFTAVWEPVIYTVSFNANGGLITEPTELEVTYGEQYGNLPTPTRDGYEFAGWFTAETGGEKVTEDNIVNIAEDHTLYAKWIKITADVTSVSFGTVQEEYTPTTAKVTLTNTGNVDTYFKVGGLSSNFIVSYDTQDTNLELTETCTITIKPNTGLPEGTYSETLTIQVGEEESFINIPVTIMVIKPIVEAEKETTVVPELPPVAVEGTEVETKSIVVDTTDSNKVIIKPSEGEDGGAEATNTVTILASSSSTSGENEQAPSVAVVITNVKKTDDNSNKLELTDDSDVSAEYTDVKSETSASAPVEKVSFDISIPLKTVNITTLPVFSGKYDEEIVEKIPEKDEDGKTFTPLAMFTATKNADEVSKNVKDASSITVTFYITDMLGGKFVAFHVKNGELIGDPIDATVGEYVEGKGYPVTITVQGFSSYVLAEVQEASNGNTGGSAVDTGSGNYQYYPRSVPTDGIVDFGTSKVVTGMELPAGSDGTVTLNIKPTFAMPENGFYAFEIDAPGYNLDAKINGGLSFQIPVADLEAAGWTAEDIVLFHGTVGEDGKITWEALPTNLVKNENGVAYYKAAINGCSPFYIGFVKDGSVVNTEVVDPTVPETPEQPVTPDEPEVLPPVEEPTEEPETPASPAPILTVFAGLGAVVALRRK